MRAMSLVDDFLAALVPQYQASWIRILDLEAYLQNSFQVGSSAWPALRLDARRFVQHLARCFSSDSDPLVWLKKVHLADLFLTCACLQRLPGAELSFEKRHIQPVSNMVNSWRLSKADLDELMQRLRVKLLTGQDRVDEAKPLRPPQLASYRAEAPLSAWMKKVARREAQVLDKERRRAYPAQLDQHPSSNESKLLGSLDEHKFRSAFKRAFETAVAPLDPDLRLLLRLLYLEGLSFEQVARRTGRATATVWRHAVRARRRIHRHMVRELGLDSESAAELARYLESKLSLSLDRILGDSAARRCSS